MDRRGMQGPVVDGKASEYYARLVERNQDMAYMDLIRKLETRFGFRELPETAQVQFNNARQTPDELLEDWADRVLSLATRAFRDLPEAHMYQQAVVRLCQGHQIKRPVVPTSGYIWDHPWA
jgi:hypothetical protein